MPMSEEARQAQRAYYREWRKKNPDKIRESNRKYWEKKARIMAEQAKGGNHDGGTQDVCADDN